MICLCPNTGYSQDGARGGRRLGSQTFVQIPIWGLAATRPWASRLASQGFHFLTREMQILLPIPSVVRFK